MSHLRRDPEFFVTPEVAASRLETMAAELRANARPGELVRVGKLRLEFAQAADIEKARQRARKKAVAQ